MSIKGDRAAILAADGTFNNVKNDNYAIGQSIEYQAQEKTGAKVISFVSKRAMRFTAAAAAAVIVAGTFTANTYAYSTVTLDVNPSLRYELNVFDRVVKFDSYNEDGEEIVEKVSAEVVGKKIDTAIEATLNALDEEEYIGEETPVVVTVDSHFSRTDALERRTKKDLDSWNEERAGGKDKKSIDGQSVVVTKELREKAREGRISPGRVVLEDRFPGPLEEANPSQESQEQQREESDETMDNRNRPQINTEQGKEPPAGQPESEQESGQQESQPPKRQQNQQLEDAGDQQPRSVEPQSPPSEQTAGQSPGQQSPSSEQTTGQPSAQTSPLQELPQGGQEQGLPQQQLQMPEQEPPVGQNPEQSIEPQSPPQESGEAQISPEQDGGEQGNPPEGESHEENRPGEKNGGNSNRGGDEGPGGGPGGPGSPPR